MNESALSPFHPGEQQVQERVGVRARAEHIGSRVIRDHLPDQHAEFYQSLDYLLVGHRDTDGWPWASFLQFGTTRNAVRSEVERLNVIDSRHFSLGKSAILPGDPLQQNLVTGLDLGFLGIDMSNRRRNRMSAAVVQDDMDYLQLEVKQTFGNCPQYIQTRLPDPIHEWSPNSVTSREAVVLSPSDQALIARSDTSFVATYYDGQENDNHNHAALGADVSHRGGQPGFIRVDDEVTLTIPDFSGNNHFNTLGNIAANGRAGLTFLDFESGDILMLTGEAEILWDEAADAFMGAERLWRFRVRRSIRLEHGLAFKYQFDSYSPRSLATDTWTAVDARAEDAVDQKTWQPFMVVGVESETEEIKSFLLKPPVSFDFSAGQYLTLTNNPEKPENTRTYTISSAPEDGLLRISVKREPSGEISNWLHETITTGESVFARPPMGAFVQDNERPAVYVAAGIGITPMIAMIRERAYLASNGSGIQPMVLFYQAKTLAQLAFREELEALKQHLGLMLKIVIILSSPEAHLRVTEDFDYKGRLNGSIFSSNLALRHYQFLLCGPDAFMQAMYEELSGLGVGDGAIYAEAFGPSSLQRKEPQPTKASNTPSAEAAIVHFQESKTIGQWTKADGTLLEFAEAQGLAPPFSCRSGKCGSCAVKMSSGEVAYASKPEFTPAESEVLLCCARPALDTEPLKLLI